MKKTICKFLKLIAGILMLLVNQGQLLISFNAIAAVPGFSYFLFKLIIEIQIAEQVFCLESLLL